MVGGKEEEARHPGQAPELRRQAACERVHCQEQTARETRQETDLCRKGARKLIREQPQVLQGGHGAQGRGNSSGKKIQVQAQVLQLRQEPNL